MHAGARGASQLGHCGVRIPQRIGLRESAFGMMKFRTVIPSVSEGAHLYRWMTQANLRNQHRTREVPRFEPDWRCLHGSG